MAQIDLKHATVYIKDGSANVGNAAITGAKLSRAAKAGDVQIFTTMTGNVVVNQTFTLTGEATTPPVHLITGFRQQGGNTVSVVFSEPLLIDLPAGTALTIPLLTGAGPNILEVRIGDGNLTYTEKQNIEYRRNRGLLDTVRLGQEEPVDVNFDFQWEFLKSDTGEPVTISEALTKTGAAVAWVSTSPDPCEPYSVDVEVRYHPPCTGIHDEVILLEMFRWETLDHNLKDGTIAVKGTSNITRAVTSRIAVTEASAPTPMEEAPPADEETSPPPPAARAPETQAA